MFFFLVCMISVSGTCCLNCLSIVGSQCAQCASPYLLYKGVCITPCGYGYTSDGISCTRNLDSLHFVSTYFASAYDYSEITVGDFSTSNNQALITSYGFLPTYDRGFYLNGNSALVGNSPWVPTTDFTLQIFFKPLQANGIILQIIDSNSDAYFTLQMANGFLAASVNTISQVDSSTYILTVTNTFLSSTSGSWFNLLLQTQQQTPEFIFLSVGLHEGTASTCMQDSELYIISISQWVLGSLLPNSAMRGFSSKSKRVIKYTTHIS